ncbi:hypothetical protein BC939DRAFT_447278 [Gamsiella multidivaricata]|uniref:uncharacterized protein n=1 Tax=Gamsiella multidivaricata TaxID=101098 RepID=UPI00221F1899|nr:uncharacterized protein BC939DRAFT_447278 [Gamsiella multidivaricata]KAI7826212.1 hypothetical protein BC939DRAFT_447278 [Gamsiella multidivaricata]
MESLRTYTVVIGLTVCLSVMLRRASAVPMYPCSKAGDFFPDQTNSRSFWVCGDNKDAKEYHCQNGLKWDQERGCVKD